jgi:hypothetical protein
MDSEAVAKACHELERVIRDSVAAISFELRLRKNLSASGRVQKQSGDSPLLTML